MLIFAILLVAGFALYVMNAEERMRMFRAAIVGLLRAKDTALRYSGEREPFDDALRARTARALVTPAIAAANVIVFALVLVGPGALSDPQTLVAWGGSIGPRTTHGEWWRLATATFVHGGLLSLLVNTAGLVQLGLVLERLVGHVAFAAVYLAAGTIASLVNLSIHPMVVTAGGSGAVFGIYGLLVAPAIWGLVYRSPLTIPLTTAKRIAPAAMVFLLYNLGNGFDSAELSGLVAGIVSGAMFVKGITERTPPLHRVVATAAGVVAMLVTAVVRTGAIADVRPEIERLVAVEERTAGDYQAAVDKFKIGRMAPEALAQVIDRTIVPELRTTRVRLEAITGVPPEQQPLVASAREYFKLREESWRLRSEGLHKGNMRTLREAERTEQAALLEMDKVRGDGR